MLFPKHIRRRLSQLARDQAAKEADAPEAVVAPPATPSRVGLEDISKERLRSRLRRMAGAPAPARAYGPPQPLEALLSGEVAETEEGSVLVLRQAGSECCDWAEEVAAKLAAAREQLAAHGAAELERVVLLDLETAGLTNAPVFLTGLLRWREGQLQLEQITARHYAEEAALLARSAEALAESDLLITFNGRTFDVPMLKDRAIYYRRPALRVPRHVDLLPLARKRFKGHLPDCKLQTLETHVCGRRRTDDIPGERIPDVYHEYVATQDGNLLVPVCRHNLLDLITMAELVGELL